MPYDASDAPRRTSRSLSRSQRRPGKAYEDLKEVLQGVKGHEIWTDKHVEIIDLNVISDTAGIIE